MQSLGQSTDNPIAAQAIVQRARERAVAAENNNTNFTAGAIYAVLAYVYDYLEGLNQVPTLVNNLARLKDVRARL